jgi:hypothetical protein
MRTYDTDAEASTGCTAAGVNSRRPPDAGQLLRACINRLKQWRGLATRYEKTATVYRVGLLIAGIYLWSAR